MENVMIVWLWLEISWPGSPFQRPVPVGTLEVHGEKSPKNGDAEAVLKVG